MQRSMGARHLIMIALGGVIGSGLFLSSGYTISQAGPLGAVIAYGIGAVVVWLVMACLGELAVAYPVSGAFHIYAARAIGPATGFTTAWLYWLCWVVALGSEFTAAGILMQRWFPGVEVWVWCLVFAAALFAINAISARVFGETEFWFSLIKVAAIIALIVLGGAAIFGFTPFSAEPHPAVLFENFSTSAGLFPTGFGGVLVTALAGGGRLQRLRAGGRRRRRDTGSGPQHPPRAPFHRASARRAQREHGRRARLPHHERRGGGDRLSGAGLNRRFRGGRGLDVDRRVVVLPPPSLRARRRRRRIARLPHPAVPVRADSRIRAARHLDDRCRLRPEPGRGALLRDPIRGAVLPLLLVAARPTRHGPRERFDGRYRVEPALGREPGGNGRVLGPAAGRMTAGGARVEIDRSALESNLRYLLAEMGSASPEVCAVLKSDAYGHGIEHVLPVVLAAGVTAVGIVSNPEARLVRELGFGGRILRVRAATSAEARGALPMAVEEWLGGLAHARALAAIAEAVDVSIPVHLALNSTGLSKESLDLGASGADAELAGIVASRRLDVRGIAAHFPREDAHDVREGLSAFRADADRVLEALGPDRAAGVQRHCATSFAALEVPESRLDLVRIGAALYGDSSAAAPWQRRAMRIVSEVSTVCRYPAGRTVGYERHHRLDAETRIATVPLGYGDGVPRSLGGRGWALVGGRSVPIVDHLAMNTLAIDVTEIPEVGPGDEVVLYGRQGEAELDGGALELASGQIAAAAYTGMGRILPREPVA
ncbi:hypothetical protein CRE_10733 [Caenorhabditis remanei]|uniref:Alanine racemase C-terminal domain-containing protein n=1 Tax=Caenorhabditis remanei TaxID=31234 RepID=E3NPC7_CAERE|nr:hypothetical protein CRE_10733 [Caenorhabditis remanei]